MEPESAARSEPEGSSPGPRAGRKRSSRAYAAIMQATIDLVLEGGYPRLTIEGVAARAKVGKSTVYRWWPTKSQLLIEAINTQLDSRPAQPTGDSRTDIRQLVQRIADILATPLGHVLPALGADLVNDPDALGQLTAMLGPRRAANASVLYSVAASGDLPYDLDTQVVLDMISGTIMYRIMMGGHVTAALVDQLTDLILAGETPRASVRD